MHVKLKHYHIFSFTKKKKNKNSSYSYSLCTQTFESQTITPLNGVDGVPANNNNNDNDDQIIIQNGNKLKKFESLSIPLWVRTNDSDESTISHSSNGHDDAHKWETFEDNDSNEVNKNNRHRGDDSDSGSNSNGIDIDGNSSILDEYDNNFPVDLSNDIAVNQMLADQGAPFNPDAEIFNVHEYDASAGGSGASNGHQQQKKQQQQQQQQESQSYEYLPYYYVNQNQFNRQNNQFEKLSSDSASSSSRSGSSSNDGTIRNDGQGSLK